MRIKNLTRTGIILALRTERLYLDPRISLLSCDGLKR